MHADKLGCNRKRTEEIEHQAGKLASSSFLATAWVGCLKSCEFFVLGPAHCCLQHFDTTVNTLSNKGMCNLPMHAVGVDMAKTIDGEQYLERGERGWQSQKRRSPLPTCPSCSYSIRLWANTLEHGTFSPHPSNHTSSLLMQLKFVVTTEKICHDTNEFSSKMTKLKYSLYSVQNADYLFCYVVLWS